MQGYADLKRRVYLWVFPVFVAIGTLGAFTNKHAFLAVILGLTALVFGVLWVTCLRSAQPPRWAEWVGIVTALSFWICRQGFRVYSDLLVEGSLVAYGVWIHTSTLLIFIMLPQRSAMGVAATFHLIMGLITLPAIDSLGNEVSTGWFNYISVHILGPAAYLGLLHVLAEVRRRYAISSATSTELRSLAYTDALTKIPNRLYATQMLDRETSEAEGDQVLSVVLFDVDHFKAINDTHGHGVGDEVLTTLATVVSQRAKRTDVVARWGGEEFVAILPFTTLEGAEITAKRIQTALQDAAFPNGLEVTCSFGVAQLSSGENSTSLMSRADEALYAAKAAGRDCVRVAEDESSTPLETTGSA